MRRKVLFSAITKTNKDKILEAILPEEIKEKRVAYMPSDGSRIPQKYVDEWKSYVEPTGAEFCVVNNSISDEKEKRKLLESNILIISGGNTFTLLNHLRHNGFDKAICEFVLKDSYVLAGFSAGAIVLSPTISITTIPTYDENTVGLEDLHGLSLIDFEIFAHYDSSWAERVAAYEKISEYKVKKLTDEDYLIIDA